MTAPRGSAKTNTQPHPRANGHVRNSEPHSLEHEARVLGKILKQPTTWATASKLSPEDFYSDRNRQIFVAMRCVAESGKLPDDILVLKMLEQEEGGDSFLVDVSELLRCTASVVNIEHDIGEVAEHGRLRQIIGWGAEIATAAASKGGKSTEIINDLQGRLAQLNKGLPSPEPEILPLEPVSTWADRPAPTPRDWVLEGFIPARRVSSFLADGGLGKTTVAIQIAVHVAMGRDLYGLKVDGGPVLGFFCEDEEDELHRRVSAACAAEGIELGEVDRLVAHSRDGRDNLLCTFDRDQISFTSFYREIDATLAVYRPRLLILDTLADLFAGEYLNTSHARQFIKTGLGGFAARHGCAVLLIAHPSASGKSSGEGDGFSTAWSNSVRSRLYLRRPRSDDPDAAKDRRVLEVRKSNYAPSGTSVPLIWKAGAFTPDPDPVLEGDAPKRAPKVDTRVATAAMEFFRTQASDRSVVAFRQLYEALQRAGTLPQGTYETVRKPLQRALGELEQAGLIIKTNVPRGYRLAESGPEFSRDTRDVSGDKLGTSGRSGHGTAGTPPIGGVSPARPSPMSRAGGEGG